MGRKVARFAMFVVLLGAAAGCVWFMMYQLNEDVRSHAITEQHSQIEKKIM